MSLFCVLCELGSVLFIVISIGFLLGSCGFCDDDRTVVRWKVMNGLPFHGCCEMGEQCKVRGHGKVIMSERQSGTRVVVVDVKFICLVFYMGTFCIVFVFIHTP